LPMYEASRYSPRLFTFDWHMQRLFASHEGSYNPLRLITFLYPFVFGGTPRDLVPAGTDWLSLVLSEPHFLEFTAYAGALPLLLALYAMLYVRRDIRIVRFLTALVLLALLVALGGYTPVYRLLYWVLPILQSFRIPARSLCLVVFGLSLLAGFGL